ncbi:Retrovirus-related Pol polyprotein from transposon opus [Gossypium australe]|uniref:Retrovirus-related Pol polyprotein from transposon opus n=1 Tax=Gossypium australe TaxID=47621 RepID=A0A5B6VBG1_9ROSI|nr:Retrovirus-related Pol polyprotein from transposon opus [Gossypium australe]
MMARRKEIKVEEHITLNASYSVIISRQVPQKLKDPRSFTILIMIGSIHFSRTLCNLEPTFNLMPLSIFEKLELGDLKTTQITLQLADKCSVRTKGVLEDVLVKVQSFIIPANFVILLGRPFLATSRSTIDLEKNELTIKINGETETFKCGHQSSDEDKKKLGEQCKKLFISYVPESKDTLPFMHAERKNKFKERDKQAQVKWHDGRWNNTNRIGKSWIGELMTLSNESGSKT